ncbi:putative short chain dehydrogenase/ reductase [Dactylonectria estremocensis]|uniref:Short chain dehydrogenase/ reductase n=1 Tax=Dactylonectria estremocensis TaxID=1079267 RepID=A0A9P9IYF4_9HYPO|nr:putative short chain dehydrogenase/ reductase [Dactylonectria estremocensis]
MAPVNCDIDFDTASLAGKTAVVTGGASGLGKAYVQALVAAKAFVCFGDKDIPSGKKLADELPNTKFVECDVTKWSDQTHLFREAASFSPSGRIHYVVANAGIISKDPVFSFGNHNAHCRDTAVIHLGADCTLVIVANGSLEDDIESAEPNLSVIDVNLGGVLFTVKLSMHYFVKQNGTEASDSQEDTCLVLASSGAGYLDCPRGPQYSATKWAIRGIMHSMRRTAFYYGSRVNIVAPWRTKGVITNGSRYVRTEILSKADFDQVETTGVQFATTEDAGQCLLRILSDSSINGRSLFVSARKWAPRGYLDLDLDDYDGNDLVQEIQSDQIKPAPVELGLFQS